MKEASLITSSFKTYATPPQEEKDAKKQKLRKRVIRIKRIES